MRVFDVAVIGAGPAAYAALTAMRGQALSIAVITGATKRSNVEGPPKIVSVAYERQQPAHLTERTVVSEGAPPLFSSAEIGGLANYWGKQLQLYDSGDPWGDGPFLESWKDYSAACDTVQADLEITGGVRREHLDNGFEKSAPRLLTGTAQAPGSGLDAMALAFKARLNELEQVEPIDGRVHRIEAREGLVSIELDGGDVLQARCVFLAAGVWGTASLLMRSVSQLNRLMFRDHAPYTINCFRLNRALGSARSYADRGNFNALTLKHKVDGRCDMFASVYAVSQAPISLLTATFGLGPHLRGKRIGRLIDFVQPVRIWTPRTQVQLRYDLHHTTVEAVRLPDPDGDTQLQRLLEWLSAHRVRHTLGTTAPGQGFHYHDLTFGPKEDPVDDVVRSAFSGLVRVVDASCLQRIGCPPHTLTSMAQAFARVRHDLQANQAMRRAI
ncbi:hypothetical protein [Ruegeria lacuscaerulensis]|uniref:hypothetical protein n=1 Tax=Ruegeria lacuscaerulensis TaxID=55218 RepID=UPI00147D2707|nr:hypothetical protein [Ruegeria lacuscaerulensis]